jgi:predicted nucleic acid-binding protein
MKPMSAKVFLDTNIIVYSYSSTEADKRGIAQKLIIKSNSFISTQVLQELTNIITKKLKYSYENAAAVIKETCTNNQLHVNTHNTILQACTIADRYGISFYDSLIISAALECDCEILYSEDMHHEMMIDKKLKIINPFK